MRCLFFIFIFYFFSCLSIAEENSFYISQVGTSARMLAMGDIQGFDQSAISVFENPASLSFLEFASVSLFSTTLFNEVEYANLAVGIKTFLGNVSLGYMSSSVSNIPKTFLTVIGDYTYVQSNSDYAVSLDLYKVGYSFPTKRNFKVGFSYSYFLNQIDTLKGSGSNYDFGLFYSINRFSLSYVIHNFIKSQFINYNDDTFEMIPMQTVLGIKYALDDLDLFFQFNFLENSKILFSLGSLYNPPFLSIFEIMAGVKQQNYLNVTSTHLTVGLGLTIGALGFYYAYEKSDHYEFDNYNYFSLRLGG